MSTDVSKFLKEGAKDGTYLGWATRPPCYFGDEVVMLEVGSEISGGVRTFHVHESILCKLDFFKAALEGGDKESPGKRVKMPEDDPIFIQCFVEFLYSGRYQEPASSELKGIDHKDTFMRKLYHARVVALGEKYSFQELYNNAAHNMGLLNVTNPGPATPANDVDSLEYIVQLYEMSGPGSILRIPKANEPVTSSSSSSSSSSSTTKPVVWDARAAATWVGRMWRDPVQKPLVEDAFKRCPDLVQDLLLMIAGGFVDKDGKEGFVGKDGKAAEPRQKGPQFYFYRR